MEKIKQWWQQTWTQEIEMADGRGLKETHTQKNTEQYISDS